MMDANTNNYTLIVLIVLLCILLVESRSCTYLMASGTTRTFLCSNYEYCCGNSCCRPAVITFYQLWYFWLSIIMIMLMCSGGSWWYRFKYRNQFLSPAGRFGTASGIPEFRHGHPTRGHTTIGVFYYPGNDRVYLQNAPKDPNSLYNYVGGVVMPPPYTSSAIGVNQYNTTNDTSERSPLAMASMMQMPIPVHQAAPPSYESVVAGCGGGSLSMPAPAPAFPTYTSPPLPPPPPPPANDFVQFPIEPNSNSTSAASHRIHSSAQFQ